MRRIYLCLSFFTFSGFLSAQTQPFEQSYQSVRLTAGIHSGYLRNSSLRTFIDAYNTNITGTKAGYLQSPVGWDMGFSWSLLQMNWGNHRGTTRASLPNEQTRIFGWQNNYVSVFGLVPFRKINATLGIGMTAYFMKFIANMRYPNGEISRTKEYILNGTYKGLSANAALRLEKYFGHPGENGFSVWLQYMGPFANASSSSLSDYNGAKNTLQVGNNSIVDLTINGKTKGFMLGVNYNYQLQFGR